MTEALETHDDDDDDDDDDGPKNWQRNRNFL
jgi:hypothetical protein